MSLNNEINFLSGERIWDETQKALGYKNSSKYFTTLKKVGALKYFDGLEKIYSKNLKFLKRMDNERNMVLEKWAIINLNSNYAKILERKIRVPNKISNFRKTFNELFQFIKKKNVDEKKLLTSLNKMNFFRNESNLLNSLDLFQKLKIISSQRIKNWKSLLKELKKVKVKVSGLEAEEIKEKIFHERLKVIQDKKMTYKTALITGGAIRIGKDICKKLHENGYNIICHFNKSENEAKVLKSELNKLREGSCEIFSLDLNDFEQVEELVSKISNNFNSLDVLVNNASSFFKTDIENHNYSDWDDLFNSNLRGPFLLSRHCKKMLTASKGLIINISDAMVNRGMKNYVIYSMAKAGLENLTKTLAREFAPEVRVNAIAPGAILLPSDGSSQEQELLSEIPLNRIGTERDISEAVVGLTKFSYVTGQILKIDGGRSLN